MYIYSLWSSVQRVEYGPNTLSFGTPYSNKLGGDLRFEVTKI